MSSRGTAEVGSAANSYEILAKLAMGGMAEIFLARGASETGVERYVVLKRVLRHRASDANFIRMFLDEARLAAQLQHPNIAQVYDIGKLGDSYFFTMEYVHGETVRTLLQRSHGLRRPIPIASVLTIIAGSAAGLHHAHERKGIDGKHLGIVHRDVSPSNLMVSYEGTVKVVDFGVAKAAHRDTETRSGTVKGKITYMSPEQCRGAELDRRSDLFSLGIVMWEMLTTERLFKRNSDFENMQAIVAEDIPLPSSLRPEIPPQVDAVVMKLLAKDPAQRFQTADELHEAVETVAVATGSTLSASSLGRFVRELFGQRPEPWIELQTNEAQPEAFTVTSEPIPAELGISPAEELDARLSSIPELARPSAPPPHVARPPQPTLPMRVQAEDLAMTLQRPQRAPTNPHGPHGFPQMQQPAMSPHPPVSPHPAGGVAMAHTPLTGVPAMQIAHTPSGPMPLLPQAPPGFGPMRPHTPSVTPPSSPQYPVLGSSSQSALSYAHANYSSARPARRSRVMIILVPAVVLGVVIGIALALGGGKKPAGDTAAGSQAGATPAEPTAAGATEPASEAPLVATGTEPTTDKPVADNTATTDSEPADGARAEQPATDRPETAADSTPVTDGKPTTAATDSKPATDGKPATAVTDNEPATDGKQATTVKPAGGDTTDARPIKKAEPPKDDVATMFKQGRITEVLAACGGSSKVLAANAVACTVAACKARDTSKARRWFSGVSSSKRAGVTKDCAGLVTLESRSSDDLCKRDLMACQH